MEYMQQASAVKYEGRCSSVPSFSALFECTCAHSMRALLLQQPLCSCAKSVTITRVPDARPAALRFRRNGSGKPSLSWPAALDRSDGAALHFNLSHTDDLMGESAYLTAECMSPQPAPGVMDRPHSKP